jgi:hypothetical protein
LIDRDRCHFRASFAQCSDQLGIRPAIFLHRDASFGTPGRRGHEFAPGIRFGNGDGNGNLHFPERGGRLGTSRDDGNIPQALSETAGRVSRGENLIKRPRADTGEKDQHVELASEKPLGERKCLLIVIEDRFPHRWRDERISALPPNQLADLDGAAAFEGKDAKAIERHPFQVSSGRLPLA